MSTGRPPDTTARAGAFAAVLVTAVIAAAVGLYTMLGQMACASCTGPALDAFESRYWTAVVAVVASVVLAVGLLVAGRLTARRSRVTLAKALTWLAPAVVALAGVLALVLIRP